MKKEILALTCSLMTCGVLMTWLSCHAAKVEGELVKDDVVIERKNFKLDENRKENKMTIFFQSEPQKTIKINNFIGAVTAWKGNYIMTDIEQNYLFIVYRDYIKNSEEVARKTGYLWKDSHHFVLYDKDGNIVYEKFNSFYSPVAVSNKGYAIVYQIGRTEDIGLSGFNYSEEVLRNPPPSIIQVLNPEGEVVFEKTEKYIFPYTFVVSSEGRQIMYFTEVNGEKSLKLINTSTNEERLLDYSGIPKGYLQVTDDGTLFVYRLKRFISDEKKIYQIIKFPGEKFKIN